MSFEMRMELVRRGWVVVLKTENLPDMRSQVYTRKKDAERAVAERILVNPSLIGRLFVERGEERVG